MLLSLQMAILLLVSVVSHCRELGSGYQQRKRNRSDIGDAVGRRGLVWRASLVAFGGGGKLGKRSSLARFGWDLLRQFLDMVYQSDGGIVSLLAAKDGPCLHRTDKSRHHLTVCLCCARFHTLSRSYRGLFKLCSVRLALLPTCDAMYRCYSCA